MARNKQPFLKGDLVFAKLKEIRHWPATITEVVKHENKASKYSVMFFGDRTTATVKESCLSLYSDSVHIHGLPLTEDLRNTKFNKALAEAEAAYKALFSPSMSPDILHTSIDEQCSLRESGLLDNLEDNDEKLKMAAKIGAALLEEKIEKMESEKISTSTK
ncbi:hypothetical protein J6590_042423 [Homalodisca vitripennis]|nr:hypothetical protein J6590_042423 [Homalodisca vitripennis]